jgi:hypothetical protein
VKARQLAASYLREQRAARNGTTRSWEVFRRAALAAAEEAAFLLNKSSGSTEGEWHYSALAIENAAAWALLDERTTRALQRAAAEDL